MKVCLKILCLALATGASLAAAPQPAAPAPKRAAAKVITAADTEKTEVDNLIQYAKSTSAEGRYDLALIAYTQLLSHQLTVDEQRVVLLGFAQTLRKKGELTKAVAVYEKLLNSYSLGGDAPDLYLELGRTLRAMGAYKSAIDQFYNVINSTIKLPANGASHYRQLAKTAQYEIAETHFMEGQYLEASRFFSRLRLLDLAPADRAEAYFKSAYALYLGKDYLGAVSQLRSFLKENPDNRNVPEAHYLLAVSYRRLKRPMEAMVEALTLLRTEKAKTAKDPKRWAYWQRRTGNQIANEFYEQGDTTDALTIYQTLAQLSNEPSWQLPVMYQIGLCEERLGQTPMAVSSYQSILDKLKGANGDGSLKELADLKQMASWRLNQITWQKATQEKLSSLLPQQPTAQVTPPPSHDSSGDPSAPPTVVR